MQTSKALVKELPILNRTEGARAPLLPPNNSNSGSVKEMRLRKELVQAFSSQAPDGNA